jgi:hypothetical protein
MPMPSSGGIRILRSISAIALSAVLLLPACWNRTDEPSSGIDLSPFKEMAKQAECSDVRNRLFLIDGTLVFWDRQGGCPDAAYAQQLFGSRIDDVLCDVHDSIAGPVSTCRDDDYRELFETLIGNLDRPDLGLGSAHTVQQISL